MNEYDKSVPSQSGGLSPILSATRAFAWGELVVLIPMHAFWMLFRSTPFVAENTASAWVAAVPLLLLVLAGLAGQVPRFRAAIIRAEWLFHLTASSGMFLMLLYVVVRDPFSPGFPITWPLCFWSVCIAFAGLANVALHERIRASAGADARLPLCAGLATAAVMWAILVWLASCMAWAPYFWTVSLVFHAVMAAHCRRGALPVPAPPDDRLKSAAALLESLFITALMLAALVRGIFTCSMLGRVELKYLEFVNIAAGPLFLAGAALALLAVRMRFAFISHAIVAGVFLFSGETAAWPIALVLGYGFPALFAASMKQGSLAYALTLPAVAAMWGLGMLGFAVAGVIIEYNMGFEFATALAAKMRVIVPGLYVIWLGCAGAFFWWARRNPAPPTPAATASPLAAAAAYAAYAAVWAAVLLPPLCLIFTTMWPPVCFERADRVEVGEPSGVCHAGYSKSDEQYANLHALGVSLMRIDFHWAQVQRDPDTWDFSDYDAYVQAAERHGVDVLALLVFDNNAVETDEEGARRGMYLAPGDLPKYLEYIRRTVTRYKGRVYAWELWNEPDMTRFWDGPIEELYELIARSAETVRETDPDAILLGPAATSPLGVDSAECIEHLHAMGALKPVDHPTMHTYISDPRGYYNEFLRIRNAAAKYGHSGSVWITELGDPDGGVYPWRGSREHLAAHVIKAHTIATCVGVEKLVWYCYSDSAPGSLRENPNNSEGFFGLTNSDGTWKPAAYAYRLFSKNCSNSTIRADLVSVTGGLAARQLRTALYRRENGVSALVMWFEPGLRPGAHARVTIDLSQLGESAIVHGITNGDTKPILDNVFDVTETPTFITFTAPDLETPVHLQATTSPADAAWLLLALGVAAVGAWGRCVVHGAAEKSP